MWARLPIDDLLAALSERLAVHPIVILQAPPGAGKSTRVPLALQEAPWLAGQRQWMLQPRRLAARAVAARMAETLGEPIGRTVGYHIRFDRQVSRETRIEVMTEGVLTRRIQADPALTGVGLLIFDEIHERHLHGDLALALARDVQAGLREDLRLLLMSATLTGETLSRQLGGAPVIRSFGRCHPVEIHYTRQDPEGAFAVAKTAAKALERILAAETGDVLAFLPGGGEIRRCQTLLEEKTGPHGPLILPLYGDLPREAQDRALTGDAQGRRRVILATDIAETSLTIEGIRVVVDGGWSRRPRFDPRSGLTRLETLRVARDSADQRAGRAGRLGPGVCYRLWSEATHRRLDEQAVPEILEADLAPLALELALWGIIDATQLVWLDPPPGGALAQARALLTGLEALDERGHLTPIGRRMAALPAHPRLAHLLLQGQTKGQGALACDLAALLEDRDLLVGNARDADLRTRCEALAAFRIRGRQAAQAYGADAVLCGRVERAASQYRRLLGVSTASSDPNPEAVGWLVALAYPDRIAGRRAEGTGYRLASGRGAHFAGADVLTREPWLAIARLDAGRHETGREGMIQLAAPLSLETLRQHLGGGFTHTSRVVWDEAEAAVIAVRETRLGALVLAREPIPDPDPEALTAALLDGIRQMGLQVLPWTPDLDAFRARVLSLRAWFPEGGWPDVSDTGLMAALEAWLSPWLAGGWRRRSHLERLNLAAALQGLLDRRQQADLETGAPTHWTVPSGSRLPLRYQPGESPVLAVRLQELFGSTDTPRVAWGRVPVTLHLLSPAQRPIQVTQDLAGFWERTYPEVKKELKGRYPKHPWPDDPWHATPTARAKPRR